MQNNARHSCLSTPLRLTMALALSLLPAKAIANDRMKTDAVHIVTDRISGIAIMGYDPVAYYTTQDAVLGSPTHETLWNGVVWRFANAANKAVFEDDPQVYAPALGGFDPIGKDRGQNVGGNPHIFSMKDNRLYFFYNTQNRERFMRTATAMNDNG
jgi:YHS domain-containing protein